MRVLRFHANHESLFDSFALVPLASELSAIGCVDKGASTVAFAINEGADVDISISVPLLALPVHLSVAPVAHVDNSVSEGHHSLTLSLVVLKRSNIHITVRVLLSALTVALALDPVTRVGDL